MPKKTHQPKQGRALQTKYQRANSRLMRIKQMTVGFSFDALGELEVDRTGAPLLLASSSYRWISSQTARWR